MGQWQGRKPSPGHHQSNDYLKQENTSGRQHGRAVRRNMSLCRQVSLQNTSITKGRNNYTVGRPGRSPRLRDQSTPQQEHTPQLGATAALLWCSSPTRMWDLGGSARKHWHIEWLLQNNWPVIFKVTKVKERLRNNSTWKERHGLCGWDLIPLLCGMALGWREITWGL